ncbi:MAG: hypothetical protein A2V67_11345 [Deltaproteobacteria bacterium RBG_13_61_14]|nr:MAG: hypothetical protein A2V67_11345 [Deltaproteobacteria bacterium RBG_13_61_14]
MTSSIQELIKRAEKELVAIRDNINLGHYMLAVSRGYFSMFYLAEAILMSEGKSFSSHQAVISALGRNFVATGRFPIYNSI